MINKLQQIENMLRNYSYTEILDYPRYIKQSTNDVWGKTICRIGKDENGNYYEDRQELENWYMTVHITKDTKLEDIVDECKAFCQEKDNQGIALEESEDYTCHQLCDWRWLESEDGKIIKEIIPGKKYSATLVKYAKILKDFEV